MWEWATELGIEIIRYRMRMSYMSGWMSTVMCDSP